MPCILRAMIHPAPGLVGLERLSAQGARNKKGTTATVESERDSGGPPENFDGLLSLSSV